MFTLAMHAQLITWSEVDYDISKKAHLKRRESSQEKTLPNIFKEADIWYGQNSFKSFLWDVWVLDCLLAIESLKAIIGQLQSYILRR